MNAIKPRIVSFHHIKLWSFSFGARTRSTRAVVLPKSYYYAVIELI